MPWALTGLAVTALLASLNTSSAHVALPALGQAFRVSFGALQWVVLAYLLVLTGLIVAAGRLGDVFGRKRLLVIGLGVFVAGSIVCGAAATFGWLVAGRAVQGLGAALMMALTMALVSETAAAKSGTAMGSLGTMSAVGTALGPSLGGALLAAAGWRAVFLANVPLGLVAVLLVGRYLRPDDEAARGGATPRLLRWELFREGGRSVALVASLLVAAVMMATLVVGPFYLARGLGLGAGTVGLVLSLGPAVAALTGVPAGRLVDGWGTRRTSVAGLLGMAAGFLVLAAAPLSGIFGYAGPVMVVTAGYALFQTANNTAVMRQVRAGEQGVVSALLNLARNLGLIAGASALGAVFARAVGATDVARASAEAVTSGMRVTFGVAVVVVGAALALVWREARRRESDR